MAIKRKSRQKGIIGIALIGVISFILLIATIIYTLTLTELTASRNTHERVRALEAAEGGIDTALHFIKNGLTVDIDTNPISIILPTEQCYDSNTAALDIDYDRARFIACWELEATIPQENVNAVLVRIVSEGRVPKTGIAQVTRRAEAKFLISTSVQTLTFTEAIFTDRGGVVMNANTTVNGSVFSNGPVRKIDANDNNVRFNSASFQIADIADNLGTSSYQIDGLSGASQCSITMTLLVVTGQNGKCIQIGDLSAVPPVSALVRADRVRSTYVEGVMACDSANSTNFGVKLLPADTCALPISVSERTNPITTAIISALENQAYTAPGAPTGIGDICDTSNFCDSDGNFDSSDNSRCNDSCSIGTLKIQGDMEIDSNDTVQVTGPLWVTGDLDIASNSNFHLDCAAYGISGDGSIIVNGQIDIASGVNFGGTSKDGGACAGSTDSYFIAISTYNNATLTDPGTNNYAIVSRANSSSGILGSTTGWIHISGPAAAAGDNVNVAAAWGLKMANGAEIQYPDSVPILVFAGDLTVGFDTVYYRICKPFGGFDEDVVCPPTDDGP